MTTQHQFKELVSLSAVELRHLIGRKEISPVELLDACITQIENVNPYVNAVTAMCYERAKKEAIQAESAIINGHEVGLLHGLPLGVKDLEDTKDLLTTYGSPLFANHIPKADNVLVTRLRQAGAIVTAKTNIPEFGAGANSRNPVWGAVGNPFNPNLNAGGSSGGSAAALATNMFPICTGSDTGGSLRIPAAKCGVVGFRPSPGLVPSERKKLGWSPLSVVGPMGRTVEDTCLQLAATAGVAAGDPLTFEVNGMDFLKPADVDLSTLKVGWSEDLGICAVDQDIRSTLRDKINMFKHVFHSCEEVELDFAGAHECFDVLRAESYVAGMNAAYQKNPDSLGPNPRANYELGKAMSLLDVSRARVIQTNLLKKFQSYFEKYDILLCPTTPVSPFPWTELYAKAVDGIEQENYYRWLSLTYVITLTSHPAISLPCGKDQHAMPFGLQIVAPFRGDKTLLGIAHALEQVFKQYPELQRPIPDIEHLPIASPSLKSIVTTAPNNKNSEVSHSNNFVPV